jgi:hypothetical protein
MPQVQTQLADNLFALDIDPAQLEGATRAINHLVTVMDQHGTDVHALYYALAIALIRVQRRRFVDTTLTKLELLDDLLDNRENWNQAFELDSILEKES